MRTMPNPLVLATCATRQSGWVTIVDLNGRITNPEGSGLLRKTIQELAAAGHRKILLNLEKLTYIDSAGVGELVGVCTTMRKLGGEMKLLKPQPRVANLLEITMVSTLFTIFADESAALASFPETSAQA